MKFLSKQMILTIIVSMLFNSLAFSAEVIISKDKVEKELTTLKSNIDAAQTGSELSSLVLESSLSNQERTLTQIAKFSQKEVERFFWKHYSSIPYSKIEKWGINLTKYMNSSDREKLGLLYSKEVLIAQNNELKKYIYKKGLSKSKKKLNKDLNKLLDKINSRQTQELEEIDLTFGDRNLFNFLGYIFVLPFFMIWMFVAPCSFFGDC